MEWKVHVDIVVIQSDDVETAIAEEVAKSSIYQVFTWDEIVSATSSFSEELRIGKGACGTVYKGRLYHTLVAVKILHSNEDHIIKQLQQELEILSRIRHPNLLLLLEACPDHGCFVYEYVENGSLEDNLLQNKINISIPWFKRYQIAWEVASVLAFLHGSEPRPIMHRDLRPANILLDGNLVSKVGDIGLSTLLHSDTQSTMLKDIETVGTLSYLDPECQRIGQISPQSDVYAFGMVILQLLTAKPARALAHLVETAIEKGNLAEILDPMVGNWPFQETLDLPRLGLSCVELWRIDRPDLKDHILLLLERLKEVADRAQHSATLVTVKSRPLITLSAQYFSKTLHLGVKIWMQFQAFANKFFRRMYKCGGIFFVFWM